MVLFVDSNKITLYDSNKEALEEVKSEILDRINLNYNKNVLLGRRIINIDSISYISEIENAVHANENNSFTIVFKSGKEVKIETKDRNLIISYKELLQKSMI